MNDKMEQKWRDLSDEDRKKVVKYAEENIKFEQDVTEIYKIQLDDHTMDDHAPIFVDTGEPESSTNFGIITIRCEACQKIIDDLFVPAVQMPLAHVLFDHIDEVVQ